MSVTLGPRCDGLAKGQCGKRGRDGKSEDEAKSGECSTHATLPLNTIRRGRPSILARPIGGKVNCDIRDGRLPILQ